MVQKIEKYFLSKLNLIAVENITKQLQKQRTQIIMPSMAPPQICFSLFLYMYAYLWVCYFMRTPYAKRATNIIYTAYNTDNLRH